MGSSLIIQVVKNPSTMQEIWVQFLGQETPGEENGNHSSILAWRSPLMEKLGWPQSTGSQRVEHDRSNPAYIDTRLFFACGSSAPVRGKREGDTAA